MSSPAATKASGLATIFVSIPSYRDPECQYTIKDLFAKAKYPERVNVGVCWQVDREEDARCFLLNLDEFRADGRLREVYKHHSEARGPCFARAIVEQELFNGEDYFLQLDSHYRMIDGWDEQLLTQIALCPSERPVLTAYPASYTLPDDYKPGGPDAAKLRGGEDPVVLCCREFGSADGFLRISGKACKPGALGGAPVQSLFWAAGFAFSPSAVLRDVPYDPNLEDLFFGEEPSMAARLWTSGWDFFAPTKVFGFHLWTRKHRPVFREHACPQQKERECRSQARVRHMLNQADAADAPVDLGVYGLGTARSLADYSTFCGVDFTTRSITDRARRGGMEAAAFVNGDPAAPVCGGYDAAAMPAMLGLMPGKVGDMIGALVGASEQAIVEPPLPPPKQLELVRRLKHLKLLQPRDVDNFNRYGIVVIDNFLSKRAYGKLCPATAASRAPAIARQGASRVKLRPAGLGRGEQAWSSAAVRGDEMTWLGAPEGEGFVELAVARLQAEASEQQDRDVSTEGQDANSDPDLDVLLVQFVALRADFDHLLMPPTTRQSIMLARYPGGGARYARHRDSLPEHGEVGKRRRITAIYYLNPDWTAKDGGCLRVFFPEALGCEVEGARPAGPGEAGTDGDWVLDVEPKIDRLVIFPSDFLEHEVMATNVDRMAVTTWLY